MSTPVRSTFSSPGSVEEVFGVLTAPSWADHKAVHLRDGSTVLQHEVADDGGVLLVVSRELPGGVPGFLERFLPKDGRVRQTDRWGGPDAGGARRGTWQVEIPGAPAQLGGTLLLEPVPGGSTYTIEGEVRVRVPVIGGRAEAFIAQMVDRLAAKEADLLRGSLPA